MLVHRNCNSSKSNVGTKIWQKSGRLELLSYQKDIVVGKGVLLITRLRCMAARGVWQRGGRVRVISLGSSTTNSPFYYTSGG